MASTRGSKVRKPRARPRPTPPVRRARRARLEPGSAIQWAHQTQLVAVVARPDNTKLALSVSQVFGIGDLWTVAAVETRGKSLEGVFEDHGHKVLGEYDFPGAILAVESYVKAWLKGHKVAKIEQCACEEIPAFSSTDLDVIDAEFEDEPAAICPSCKHNRFHHKAPDLLGCIGSAECRCTRTAASIT
jgi:hypothetical protein